MKRILIGLSLLSVLLFVSACIKPNPTPDPKSQVPIASFQSIAGKWEGLMSRDPPTPREDWVRLYVWEDGDYEFASYREQGVFKGKGKMMLSGGQAMDRTPDGGATLTLFIDDGKRILRAVGVTKNGLEYTAYLTQSMAIIDNKEKQP